MGSMFGKRLKIALFGESHQPWCGLVVDGLPAGLTIDEVVMEKELALRRPVKDMGTARVEQDRLVFLSGVFEGKSDGSPLCIAIANENIRSEDYVKKLIRPSHADFVAHVKYHGANDYRGGGHFSGRVTAPLVAFGALCKLWLLGKGIDIVSQIVSIGTIEDSEGTEEQAYALKEQWKDDRFPVFHHEVAAQMQEEIKRAKQALDSVGGQVRTYVFGLPIGIGEPYFEGLDALIASALFSIGGVKGVYFGDAVAANKKRGSETNDGFTIVQNQIQTTTNRSGGVQGGISNGMPLVVTSLCKPTPTIGISQATVDLETMKEETYAWNGRHDPCIVPRIRFVLESMIAFTIVDQLMVMNGERALR